MNKDDIIDHFLLAEHRVVSAGYEEEINYWRESPSFSDCTEQRFFEEYSWCVINLGIREQVCRRYFDKFLATLDPSVVTCRFKEKKQAALTLALAGFVVWFGELKAAKDPIKYLGTLPLVGNTTKWHLARNIGIDCVKPDIHLKRLAARFGFVTPQEMGRRIQREFPERLGTIDYILWRDCNLNGVPV